MEAEAEKMPSQGSFRTDRGIDPGRWPAPTGGEGMRILIADDHMLLRDTLVLYFQNEEGIETATAADFDEAERMLREGEGFDLVLLDFSMPGMDGLSGLTRMMQIPGHHRVAIISGTANREVAEQALAAGAAGFLPKTLSARSLVNAVRFMALGEQYAPLDFLRPAEEEGQSHPLAEMLSSREMEVLEGLTQGKSNKEIARDLDIREPTVKLHVKTLYRKIGASNRTQAAMIAKDQGLF
jgi:DNA-binding NarL/FixJ family response regulator